MASTALIPFTHAFRTGKANSQSADIPSQFSVFAEGQSTALLSDYRVLTQAGSSLQAITESRVVEVTDGNLDLNFVGTGKEVALLSALEIYPYEYAPIADVVATVDGGFSLDLKAQAPNAQLTNLNLNIPNNRWLRFDPNTCVLTGIPSCNDQGVYTVSLTANTPGGHSIRDQFTITVPVPQEITVDPGLPLFTGKQELANDGIAELFPCIDNEEQTFTVYSLSGNVYYCGEVDRPQRYLQNRVSYTFTFNRGVFQEPVTTYYSYDPHGNVEWIIQDVPGLGRKQVAYEYDLISGKVLQVSYNECDTDRFYHKYDYDEDNRLIAVLTSRDEVVWEQDAHYRYYPHGPLQRTELGESHVQGLDYAYTIHGWLKGVNGLRDDPTLQNNISNDGNTGSLFAPDVCGMVLGYYNGDYQYSSVFGSDRLAGEPGNNVWHLRSEDANGDLSLYNGNISTWATYNEHQETHQGNEAERITGHRYRYDYLNRITSSVAVRAYANGQNYWVPLPALSHPNRHQSNYTYDGNGNLLSLQRYNQAGDMIDNLSYAYESILGAPSNRLKSVTDGINTTAFAQDIVGTHSYDYDAIGNLVRDHGDHTIIDWNVYGKVSEVSPDDQSSTVPLIRYRYDAAGNRVSKEVTLQNGDTRNTYYIRDAQGNVLSIYEQENQASVAQREVPIYGSDRLGMYRPGTTLVEQLAADFACRISGQKRFELKDHLGNVRMVISDQKLGEIVGNSIRLSAQVLGHNDYYPFGMEMPERSFQSADYRYGFNGKENDREWGTGGLVHRTYGV